MTTLACLLLASVSSIGCSITGDKVTVVELHPIEKSDIFRVKKDSVVSLNSGDTLTVEKDGWFLSDLYVDQVMKARLNK